MDIILLERVEKLGQMGDVVKVKDGFARNYLLPQKKALRATAANKEQFEIPNVQISDEPYGLGMRKGDKNFVDFVNKTILEMLMKNPQSSLHQVVADVLSFEAKKLMHA